MIDQDLEIDRHRRILERTSLQINGRPVENGSA
jgi:hypothetical protein